LLELNSVSISALLFAVGSLMLIVLDSSSSKLLSSLRFSNQLLEIKSHLLFRLFSNSFQPSSLEIAAEISFKLSELFKSDEAKISAISSLKNLFISSSETPKYSLFGAHSADNTL